MRRPGRSRGPSYRAPRDTGTPARFPVPPLVRYASVPGGWEKSSWQSLADRDRSRWRVRDERRALRRSTSLIRLKPMTIIVATRKGNKAAIAADSQSSQGSIAVPGDMKQSDGKILAINGAYIGLAGNSAHLSVFRSVSESHPELIDFTTAESIFEMFRAIHPILKEQYHLITEEDDDDQEYESNQMAGVICSSGGIFSFLSYREITEHRYFWAAGSGIKFALGSLETAYRTKRDPKAIAELAVRIACKFDNHCGLPLESHTVEIERRSRSLTHRPDGRQSSSRWDRWKPPTGQNATRRQLPSWRFASRANSTITAAFPWKAIPSKSKPDPSTRPAVKWELNGDCPHFSGIACAAPLRPGPEWR